MAAMTIEQKYRLYESLLAEWNLKINLVSRGTLPDIRRRHIDDSARLAEFIPRGKTVIDMGAGAGFPSAVLAILGFDVIAIESIRKKCRFLETLRRELDLPNLTIINDRVENAIPRIISGQGMPRQGDASDFDESEYRAEAASRTKSNSDAGGAASGATGAAYGLRAPCRGRTEAARKSPGPGGRPGAKKIGDRRGAKNKGRKFRADDFVLTARAFAPLIKILDMTAKFGIPHILIKGRGAKDELDAARAKHRFDAEMFPGGVGGGFIIKLTTK
jgi:16S rRNA G527 N7-methylase RsmG